MNVWRQFEVLHEHAQRRAERFARHGDDRVTVRQAREVLAEASCWLPLYPHARRVRGGPSRIAWWRMCLGFASKDKDPGAFLPPICATVVTGTTLTSTKIR